MIYRRLKIENFEFRIDRETLRWGDWVTKRLRERETERKRDWEKERLRERETERKRD